MHALEGQLCTMGSDRSITSATDAGRSGASDCDAALVFKSSSCAWTLILA